MSLSQRDEIVVRVVCGGTTLLVPGRGALFVAQNAASPPSPIGPIADTAAWAVHWQRAVGDWLKPNDLIARLYGDGIVIELLCAAEARLAEILVAAGAHVATGVRLARLERRARVERRAKPVKVSQTQLLESFSQFAVRQMQDAETIDALRQDLATQQQLVDTLRGEIAFLRAQRVAAPEPVTDLKFRRLKQEFSKRFHPDARPLDEAGRRHCARVFQEFWPVVEAIERS